MRVIVIGCEYSGVTTLIDGLMDWGHERGIHHHLDDHFAIPDSQHISAEEAQAMLDLPPVLKERFQRFQLVYHVRLLHRYEHILMGGFHIEEAIYGPRYYYPGVNTIGIREYEPEMPDDTILVYLHADPDVITARMAASPHEYTVIRSDDIPDLLESFEKEYRASWISRKLQIDTSDLTPEQLLQTFLTQSLPYLNTRDMLTRMQESST